MFETRRLSSKIVLQVILTIMVLPFLFPLIAMVQESLAGQGWDNYRVVWDTGVVPEFFRNSAIIAAGVIIIVYALTMLAAFGFSKLHIRGREIYFWMMLVALTLPEVVLLTPLFATTIKLNLYNTYWAVIIPLSSFFVSEFSDDQTKVLASAVITAIPEIVAYLCLQRLFERGLSAGALK